MTQNRHNECREHESLCHCVLDEDHDGPHECVPDPICGGKWWRHPDDGPASLRVYRFPSNRPGCDMYDEVRRHVVIPDPPDGEYVTVRAPLILGMGALNDYAEAVERRLLDDMRSEGE